MSKIMLISDLHLANRVNFGRQMTNPTFVGCNSRFHSIASAIKDYVEIAEKEQCEAIVIPGDILHERMVIPIPVLNAVYELLEEANKKVPVYAMTGNHDVVSSKALYGEDGLHSLYVFQNVSKIIEKPTGIATDNFYLSFLPFNISKEKTLADAKMLYNYSKKQNKLSLAFFHHSFEGAVTGPTNWKIPSEILPSEVPDFDLVFSGHLHNHQTIDKITYVGSLVQHDLGERNYIPGGIIVSDDGSWKHIPNKASPRFVVVEASTAKELSKLSSHDYKVIKWRGEEKEGINLREDMENTIVEIVPMDKKSVARTNISTFDTVEEMMKKYVKAKLGLHNEAVLKEGLKIYKNGNV